MKNTYGSSVHQRVRLGQAPAIHSVSTPPPPGAQQPPPPPGLQEVPQEGCTIEELRIFVINRFQDVGKEITTLEDTVGARVHIIDVQTHELSDKMMRLEPLTAHVHDLDVFARA